MLNCIFLECAERKFAICRKKDTRSRLTITLLKQDESGDLMNEVAIWFESEGPPLLKIIAYILVATFGVWCSGHGFVEINPAPSKSDLCLEDTLHVFLGVWV